jgi:hypothetical protein
VGRPGVCNSGPDSRRDRQTERARRRSLEPPRSFSKSRSVRFTRSNPAGKGAALTGEFVSIEGPQARATIASAINAHRDVVGRYNDKDDRVHGFLRDAEGHFETLDVDVRGADLTVARGVNDAGDVVGMYRVPESGFPEKRHGFIFSRGHYATIDFPGPAGTNTFAWNVTGDGTIVGVFSFPDDGFKEHGFVLAKGVWKRIDHPAAAKTFLSDIDSRGRMLGTWYDEAGSEHGFLIQDDSLTEVSVVDADSAFFDALRDSGTTSGVYTERATRLRRGFVRDKDGRVTTIDHPGLTVVRDINNHGDLVGRYVETGKERGYVIWEGYEGD